MTGETRVGDEALNRLSQDAVERAQTEASRVAHQQQHEAHEQAHDITHEALQKAVDTAFDAQRVLAEVHAKAHEREHQAHEVRHQDQATAVQKAEMAVDKRLEGMNALREQLNAQALTFSTIERVDTMQSMLDRRFAEALKNTDQRYEENRRRIELLEKGDVKQEGRGLGQGAVIAVIVGSVGFVATLLSVIIVVANALTT